MRRLKGFFLGEDTMDAVFSGSAVMKVVGMPQGAKFKGAYFDHMRQGFIVVYEHESFETVPEGMAVPLFNRVIEAKNVRAIKKLLAGGI